LRLHGGAGFLDGRCSRSRSGMLQWADRAYTQWEGKHVMHHLLCRPFGQVLGSRTQRHGGLDPRTIGATGDPCGPRRAGHLAACRAEPLMPVVLGHDRLDRRELPHLMPPWRGIVPRQTRLTGRARLRLDTHDLINFFHWAEGTRRARRARLTATTAFAPRTTRTGMHGRIARRRT
jgi:hypothetical protein